METGYQKNQVLKSMYGWITNLKANLSLNEISGLISNIREDFGVNM